VAKIYFPCYFTFWKLLTRNSNEHSSSVSVVTNSTGWRTASDFLQGHGRHYLFTTSSKPAVGLTQPPAQWVPGGSFAGGRAADA
jgi:hypothetical protein